MFMESESYHSASEDETNRIGKTFSEALRPGDIVSLSGEIGAGKTEFVKGICEYFGVEDIVSSPTFTIINQYFGTTGEGEEITMYHVDLYRIKSAGELAEIGFQECMYAENAVKLVEWPENAGDLMPQAEWEIAINFDGENDNKRTIEIRRGGSSSAQSQ